MEWQIKAKTSSEKLPAETKIRKTGTRSADVVVGPAVADAVVVGVGLLVAGFPFLTLETLPPPPLFPRSLFALALIKLSIAPVRGERVDFPGNGRSHFLLLIGEGSFSKRRTAGWVAKSLPLLLKLCAFH
jgi:hypothetical protein